MRIALFGGSFNPPHVSHLLACTYVLATARPRVDRVWMLPTWKHPFDKPLAPFEDRVEMCRLAAAVLGDRVEVCSIEGELGGESYTLRTVKTLRQRHPELDFALMIGADLVAERERWHGWEELRTLLPFVVVGRVGAGPGVGLELPPVSSTDIRGRIARGEPVSELVPADVLDYVEDRQLYREPG